MILALLKEYVKYFIDEVIVAYKCIIVCYKLFINVLCRTYQSIEKDLK